MPFYKKKHKHLTNSEIIKFKELLFQVKHKSNIYIKNNCLRKIKIKKFKIILKIINKK